jgi:hypothetical protein
MEVRDRREEEEKKDKEWVFIEECSVSGRYKHGGTLEQSQVLFP